MRTVFKLLILSPLFLLLASCEDVVQIKLDEGSKLLVVDAFINDLRTRQTIKVVNNDSYFSNKEAPPVTNAIVILKDLSNNRQYTFNYSTNGNYVYDLALTDTLARINHQYELNVIVDEVTYTSLTTQKRTAKIDSIEVMKREREGGFGPGQSTSFTCRLAAKDKADNNPDYYWVKTFRNDTLFFGSNDINLSIDGTNGAVMDVPADSTEFTEPVVLLGFKRYRSGDVCEVEIHSIAGGTYDFFSQAAAQINNGGLFATTPENVKTNIVTPAGAKTKAVGWFNMATVTSLKVSVK